MKIGIRIKINSLLFVSMLAVGLSIGITFYFKYSDYMMQTVVDKLYNGIFSIHSIIDLEGLTKLDRDGYKTPVYKKNWTKIKNLQEELKLAGIYVILINRQNQFYFVYDTDENPSITTDIIKNYFSIYNDAPTEAYLAFMMDKMVVVQGKYTDRWGTFKSAFNPIRINEKVIGVIGADYNISAILELKKQALLILGLLLIVGFLITTLVSFAIKRWIIMPIVRLNDGSKEIAQGNLDYSIPVNQKDEIGELAINFNRMAKNLKSSFGTIRENNEQLEKIVQERTIDLEETKSDMEAVNHFTYLINSFTSLDEIFIEISKYMNLKYNIMGCWFFLPDAKKEYLYSYKVYSYNRLSEDKYNYLINKKIPLNEKGGLLYIIYKRQKPFYLGKIKKIEFAIDKEIVRTLSAKSFLYIPLISKNQCVGILSFTNLDIEMKLQKKEVVHINNLYSQIAGVIETTHLLQEVKKAKKQTEELNQLIKSLNEELDIKVIMQKVFAYVKNNFEIQHYALYTVNQDKKTISLLDVSFPENINQDDRSIILNSRISIVNTVGAHTFIFRNKKPIYIHKVQKKGITEEELFVIEKGNLQSILMIPLFLHNKAIGSLDFSNVLEMNLTEDDISRLSILGEQLAGIIHGSNLFKQVQEEKQNEKLAREEAEKIRKEIEYLNEFSKLLNSENNLDLIFKYTVEHFKQKLDADFFWLQLITRDQKKLFTRCLDTSNNFLKETIEYYKQIKFKLHQDSGAMYSTYSRKRTLYLSDIGRVSYEILSDIDKKLIQLVQTKSVLQVPLLVQNEVIGIMHINKFGGMKNQSQSNIKSVKSFCEQLAIAVHNASLYEEVEDQRQNAEVEKGIAVIAQHEAELERDKSEKLLLNILPKEVARELKENGFAAPVLFESVSVLFTDFKGFTSIAEKMTPHELVSELDSCFSYFDSLMERYGIEKLKTIGDSYMCAAGIPQRNLTHAVDAILAAIEIQSFMNMMKELKEKKGMPYWELRLGIHSGPLVAGVIGDRKFAYDVWGDTVNTASRMESSGTPGKINISGSTYELVKSIFDCEYRGRINAKNKGEVDMYYVLGVKSEYSKNGDCKTPNESFWKMYGDAGIGM